MYTVEEIMSLIRETAGEKTPVEALRFYEELIKEIELEKIPLRNATRSEEWER